jgi:hypothetical protein
MDGEEQEWLGPMRPRSATALSFPTIPPTQVQRVWIWAEQQTQLQKLHGLHARGDFLPSSNTVEVRLSAVATQSRRRKRKSKRFKRNLQSSGEIDVSFREKVLKFWPLKLTGSFLSHSSTFDLSNNQFLTLFADVDARQGSQSNNVPLLGITYGHAFGVRDLLTTSVAFPFRSSEGLIFSSIFSRKLADQSSWSLGLKVTSLENLSASFGIQNYRLRFVKDLFSSFGVSLGRTPKLYCQLFQEKFRDSSKKIKLVCSIEQSPSESEVSAKFVQNLNEDQRFFVRSSIGTASSNVEVGLSQSLNPTSKVNFSLSIDSANRIDFNIRFQNRGLKILLPITLFEKQWTSLFATLFAGVPLLTYAAFLHFSAFKPLRRRLRLFSTARISEEEEIRERILQEQKDLAYSQLAFLAPKAEESRQIQTDKNGLIILDARYGVELWGSKQSAPDSGRFAQWESVAIALQFWVDREKSTLDLGTFSKSSMLGFYKTKLPAGFSEDDRSLWIRYQYGSDVFEGVYKDFEAVHLPDSSHRRVN